MTDMPATHNDIIGASHTTGGVSAQANTFTAQGNINIGSPVSSHASHCLSQLLLTDPRDDRREILARKDELFKDLCLWVCSDPSYLRWRYTDEFRIFWLHGDPGKGKTMIMMALADQVSGMAETTSRSVVLSYFFCQSTNSSNNTATSVLRGLIYLLVRERPKLLNHVQRKFDDAGTRLLEGTSTLYSLWGILSDIVNDPSLETVYLMIDALDECDVERINLLDLITNSELRHSRKIKWLVSSRNELWIRERLDSGDWRQHISLELTSEHVSMAVGSFIDLKVEVLARQKKYSAELKTFVRNHLVEHADDTFLWVALVCKELANTTMRKTRTTIKKFPVGLVPLYDRMLSQVDGLPEEEERSYCRRVLQAATLSSRPLRLQELVFVAALPREEFEQPESVREVVQQCGSFLTLRNDVCYFVHQSAKDYFDKGLGARIFEAGQMQAHSWLSGCCLELMSHSLRHDICDLRHPGTQVQEIDDRALEEKLAPDLRYACCYWIDHLLKPASYSNNDGVLLDAKSLHVFFQRFFLYWLETLSLLGRIFEAVNGLLSLELALQNNTEAGQELMATVIDAKRFLLAFRTGIELAPLQIYCSALIFSPQRSVTKRNYELLIPSWMEQRPNVEETWGASLHTLEGHSDSVRSVVFSGDGKLVASGSHDRTVRIWDTMTGASLHTLEGHLDSVTSVIFSGDSKLVASGSHDGTVRIWATTTGASLHTLEGHLSWVTSVVFSGDGKLVASGSDDETVRIWDTITGAWLHTLEGHLGWVTSVVFSGDGKLVASGSDDGTVRIWDTTTGALLHTLDGHLDSVTSVVFSGDGKLVASGSHDRTVRIWDTTTGALLHTLEGHSGSVKSVIFSGDGKLVASGSDDKTVRIWDTTTGASLHTLEGHLSWVKSVAFSGDGKLVASGSTDKTVRIWDATTGASLHTLEGHLNWVTSVVFSGNSKLVASGSYDKTVRIWDTTTGASLHKLDGRSGWVTSVVFSGDGKLVAAGSDDGTVRIWEVKTGKCVYCTKDVSTSEPLAEIATRYVGWIPLKLLASRDLFLNNQASQLCSQFGVEETGQWIVLKGTRLLWLPANIRPGRHAVRYGTFMLGSGSGRMTLLRLNEDAFNRRNLKRALT